MKQWGDITLCCYSAVGKYVLKIMGKIFLTLTFARYNKEITLYIRFPESLFHVSEQLTTMSLQVFDEHHLLRMFFHSDLHKALFANQRHSHYSFPFI